MSRHAPRSHYTVHRRFVFDRDGGFCQWCGQPLFMPGDYAGGAKLVATLDHIFPRGLNGSDDPENLLLSCTPCNSGRGKAQGTITRVIRALQRQAAQEYRAWLKKTAETDWTGRRIDFLPPSVPKS